MVKVQKYICSHIFVHIPRYKYIDTGTYIETTYSSHRIIYIKHIIFLTHVLGTCYLNKLSLLIHGYRCLSRLFYYSTSYYLFL